uniref:Putative conserved plasma membrane protein n=1 Tax=Culex tarsalis TaxID=7177 RepID=A0A1Q3FIH2_CULTA
MSTLVNMYRAMRGSPAALLGGAMLITTTVVVGYKRLYEPYAARKRREDSEYVAEYIFRAEQHAKGIEVPDGFGEMRQADG